MFWQHYGTHLLLVSSGILLLFPCLANKYIFSYWSPISQVHLWLTHCFIITLRSLEILFYYIEMVVEDFHIAIQLGSRGTIVRFSWVGIPPYLFSEPSKLPWQCKSRHIPKPTELWPSWNFFSDRISVLPVVLCCRTQFCISSGAANQSTFMILFVMFPANLTRGCRQVISHDHIKFPLTTHID